MEIVHIEVNGFTMKVMPKNNETIEDHMYIDALLENGSSFTYYYREPHDCPFGKGNWILDMIGKDGEITCFRFPKQMTEKRFLKFLHPLLSRIKML